MRPSGTAESKKGPMALYLKNFVHKCLQMEPVEAALCFAMCSLGIAIWIVIVLALCGGVTVS